MAVGAAGIGVATCRHLVAEGAQVVAADVDAGRAQALSIELGSSARAQAFDVGGGAASNSSCSTIEQCKLGTARPSTSSSRFATASCRSSWVAISPAASARCQP
jgi:NAD(P)-dependent dehydrogenase (short-subunit alcohol dehydrogenase family)